MEKRKHFWNGRWGRLARRDVLMFEDAGFWRVEDRTGGAEGRSRWAEFDDEEAAVNHVSGLVVGMDEWRELL